VSHRAGDLRRDAFGGPYDVVLMCNILHHFAPEENREWIRKARGALGKDGTLAIRDFETPDSGSRPTEGAAAALFFRLTSSARCYSGMEYARWVREAGFREVRIARPLLSPGTVLVTGRA
jgi:cyclopropane fatty-acyl-phospholipid synthase-like methyltransferase